MNKLDLHVFPGDPFAPIKKVTDFGALFTLGLYVTPDPLASIAVVVPALGDKVFDVVVMGLPVEFLCQVLYFLYFCKVS